jgi:phosphatidylglycerol:prolipoprotein diacylglycerol transferase
MGLTGTDGVVRYWHPTFLYESIWNFIGFILLHFLSRKRKFDGQVFLWYVAWYGLGRVWIEGLRTDSLYLPGTSIRVSQLLAGISCLAAVGILTYVQLKKKPDGSTMLVNQKKAAEKPAEE